MLALFLASALSAISVRAQSYTPVPYNFAPVPRSAPISYADNNKSYNEIVRAMAANGYGLWQSSLVGTTNDWKLSGYGLAQADASLQVPDGVFNVGSDNRTDEEGGRKVVANLLGSVRYVGLNSTFDGFIVAGLNDAQVGGPSASEQISINLPNSTTDNLLGDPAKQNLIAGNSGNEYVYPAVPTKITGEYCDNNQNAFIGFGDEDDNLEWDVAMDGHSLYIVWEHSHEGTCAHDDEIFLTCTDLSTGGVQSGFPITFHARDPALECNAEQVGDGDQPTVACDVRNNSNPDVNGFYHPACDIAFIDNIGQVWHFWVNSNTINNPATCSIEGDPYSFSEKFAYEQLPDAFTAPSNNPPNGLTTASYAPTTYYNGAARARIMVASAAGLTSTVLGCYVLTPDGSGNDLLFFNKPSGVWQGFFVDGTSFANDFPLDPPPVRGTAYYEKVGLPSNQIVCFTNPYDGEADGNFDEFHCVYTASTYDINNNFLHDGLMIVRGADNGVPWLTSPPTHDNTRTVVNQSNGTLLGTTNSYCAAANEAGIHIRWDDGTTEYYSRDRRSFDEPIEENTILSYDNYIADGSSTGSNHGGTLGAQTNAGKTVLVWTDPILFGIGSRVNAHYNNAQIYFGDANGANVNAAGLTIGNTTVASSSNPASKLILCPNFECIYPSPALASNRNFIQMDRSGSCDFYGLAGGMMQANFAGGGDFNLNSTSDLATLNIMPLCIFTMSNDAPTGIGADITGIPRLNSTHGSIISEHGNGANNAIGDGFAIIDGAIALDHSDVSGSADISVSPNILTLNGVANCPFSSTVTFCAISDNETSGIPAAQIKINDPLTAVTFDHTTMSAVELYVNYALHTSDNPIPSRPLTVTNGTFENMPSSGIHLVRNIGTTDDNTVDFAPIVLDGNTFETFLGPRSDGIKLEDFVPNVPGDLANDGTQLEIESNAFTTASTFGTTHPADTSHVEAAIHLINSSAVVDDNTIDGERSDGTYTYAYGILMDMHAYNQSITATANSLLCHNTISYVGYALNATNGETGGGILTRDWKGYEKMNEISHSAQGSIFDSYDAGIYLEAYYHDNNRVGINITSDYFTRWVEMRGLIHTDDNYSGDMAGFNRIIGNNTDNNSASGQVVVSGDVTDDGVSLLVGNQPGTGSASITYGENSFVENTTGGDLLFYTPSTNQGYAHIGDNSGELDDDYLEVAGTRYAPLSLPSQYSSPFLNFSFDGSSPAWLPSVPNNIPTIYCYGGNDRTKRSDAVASLPSSMDTNDECYRMANYIGNTTDNQKEYDTAKAFTTLCYNNPRPLNGISGFGYALAGNDNRNTDPRRFVEFREWLKSVLYLRTDTQWYCTDVGCIIHTIGMYYEGVHGYDASGVEAIIRYIVDHQRCDSVWTARIKNEIVYPAALYEIWRDTVKDSLTEPRPDTTVPSIDSIGLSILRGPQFAGVTPSPIPSGADNISELYVTENPFTNTTAIKFTLAGYGLVTFQLFDVLGHAVTTNGIGQVLYPGAHEFDIDGSKLPPGNYIARVAFHNGDVESIMVVKK